MKIVRPQIDLVKNISTHTSQETVIPEGKDGDSS